MIEWVSSAQWGGEGERGRREKEDEVERRGRRE